MSQKIGPRLKVSCERLVELGETPAYKAMFVFGGFLAVTSTELGRMLLLLFYVWEHPKAQQAVVPVLNSLRGWGHSLKSPPTDWGSGKSNFGLLDTRQVTYPLYHGRYQL